MTVQFNNPSPKDKENKSQQSSTLKFSVVSLRKVKVFGTDAASDADGDAANRIALEKQRHHVTLQVALDNSRVVLTRGTTGVDGTIEEEEDHEEDDDEDVVIVDADGGDVNKRRSKSRGVKGGQGEKKEGEASGVPTAHVSPDLKFERLVDAALGVNVMGTDNALAAATDKVFGDHELQIWKLCAALWDPLYLPDSAGAGDGRDTSRQAAGAILAALRKEEVSRWLKEAVKKDVEAEVGESVASGSVGGASAAAKVLFGLLTGRQIGRAVGESIKSRNLRLATILSQLGGAGARVVTNRTGVQRLVGGSPVEAASGHGVPGRGGTDEDVRKHIVEQVRLWREAAAKVSTTSIGGAGGINAQAPISALMSEDLFASWLLCAGEVQDWLKEVFPRVTDWKRTWGLFLWYGEGGWWDLKESVEKYEAWVKKMKNLGGVVRPPLPHYIEKRLRRLRGASGVESDAADCLFHLLKLYTNERYLLERVCRPAAVGPDPLDVRVPWLLWLLLSKVKRVKEFKDAKVKVVEVSRVVDGGVDDDDDTPMFGASRKSAFGRSTMTIVSITQGKEVTTSETLTELQPTSSLTADALTSSLVFQLEALGLWTWACFVGMHLGTASGREAAVKELLSRWYPLEDASGSCWKGVAVGNKDDGNAMAVDRQDAGGESEEWRFLIGQLRIPQQWVFEAKVVRARYEGDVIQEAAALIDCEAFALAHKSIVLRVAPSAIINGDFEYLEALLTHLPDWLDTWDLAGGLIKQYIHIAKHVPKLLDTADEPLLNPRSRSNSVRIGSSTATMSVEEDIVKDAKSTLRGHWIDRLRDVLERLAEVKKRGGFEAIFRVGLLDGWGDAAMEGVGAREEQQGGQEQPRKRNRGGFANSPRVCLAEMTGRTAMLLGEIERVCQDDHDDLEAAAEKDGELLMELALPEDQRLARLHRLSEDWFSVALSVAVRGVKSY
ncbi:hypothetical protein HK102_011850 [Quaeritorhiza haematococci]|nr:hypothetical protein HK102_011850 [Quaeritorhiza haematococci]